MSANPTSDTGGRIRGWHVLLMFVAFFGVVIAVNTGFVVMALRTFPGEVSVTPYEDGLLYDKKLAQLAAQERLGWRAIAAGEPGAVIVEMRDASGAPLKGLVMTGELERPATSAGLKQLSFREAEPGRYVARPGALAGAWDLTAKARDAAGHAFEAERRLQWP